MDALAPTAYRATFRAMTMKNFFIALAITGLFLGILLVAGTAQNKGCLPWKEPITVGGGGAFSEDRGDTVCR